MMKKTSNFRAIIAINYFRQINYNNTSRGIIDQRSFFVIFAVSSSKYVSLNYMIFLAASSFSIANNLRRHQRTHDSNRERNFSCNDCGRTFFTEDVYRTHVKIHQTSRRAKFACNQCDKTFMHKGSLTLHIQKHTGPKNECNICQKRYVRKIDLDIHMRNHSGDLPYKCCKCDKAFMTTSALRKHEVLHTGVRYKCDICNKEYSHPSKLTRHILYHTGLPLKCAICNKGFAEPNK